MQERSAPNPYYQCYDNKVLEQSLPDLSYQKQDTIPDSNDSTLAAKNAEAGNDGHSVGKSTSYLETLMHLFKGNVGPGELHFD